MKIQVIVNPSAGGGKGKKNFPFLVQKIRELDFSADFALPKDSKEALAIALRAPKNGCDLLVACGGDGTVHSLLPALVNRPMALGLIPIGTANDIARNWKIPFRLDRALEILSKGHPRAVDVIETHSGTYIAGAGGIGFDAAVVERANHLRRRWKGISPFLLAIPFEFSRYRPPLISITAGNWKYQGPAWQVIFTKISRYALLLKIAPPLKMDNGLMEICLVPDCSRIHLLLFSLFFPFLGFKAFPAARFHSAPEMTIESSSPVKFHGDGELMGHTPAMFRVVSKALQVLMPPENSI